MKTGRHEKIIEIISNNRIETQEELAKALNEAGFRVTQATVSRDIRELKLMKISQGDGQYYALFKEKEGWKSDKYIRVLKDDIVSMDTAQNILVIKTISGMAMAAAAALDSFKFEELVGCIAGDDTIMCAIRTNEEAMILKERLKKIIE